MAERYFTLYKNKFKSDRNTWDSAIYEMQISTWAYTKKARLVDTVTPIEMRDLKASIVSTTFSPHRQ